MVIVHLMASPFLGGPERQALGLAAHLLKGYRTVFLSFFEKGQAAALLNQARQQGLEAIALQMNAPNLLGAAREVASHLQRLQADVLLCHGYKPDLIGLWAARKTNVPVISVSRGWTWASWRVRCNETLDRWCLRWMDRVICVSEAQAEKVRRAGVRPERVVVIRNAINLSRFEQSDPGCPAVLEGFFRQAPRLIVAAAGRLSPEKGFRVLVDAAARVVRADPSIGFIHFGDGPLRLKLTRQIARCGLNERFILAGFHEQIDRLLPYSHLVVLPSFTEGLPNVALEASAAGVPVVASAVGGTPEIVRDGVNGLLVPPGHPDQLAARILELTRDADRRRELGRRGQELVRAEFTFAAQSQQYQVLFEWIRKQRGNQVP